MNLQNTKIYLQTLFPKLFGSNSKNSACNAEDLGSIPGSGKSPGGWHDNPHFSILAWRIPWTEAGYSPWGHKESDTTEQLTLSLLT